MINMKKNLYLRILLFLCLVSLFLIGIFYLENKIKKTKHIPISEGLSYNNQTLITYLV